jgi:deoxyribonuclease-4
MEVQFVRRVGMGNQLAKEVGELAKELNIKLSVHAPYYVNLCSQEKEKLEASKKRILGSCERASFMQASPVTFHPGFYGNLTSKEAFQAVKKACEDLIKKMRKKRIKNVELGLETMGKQSTFGTVEETVRLCKEVRGCVPVVDWAHLYARSGGGLKNQEDFTRIFDKLKSLKLKHLHSHFTCVEFSLVEEGRGNERKHLTLDAKKPGFEPLVKEILKRKTNITLISESPILEKDSLVLKKIFEKNGYKF